MLAAAFLILYGCAGDGPPLEASGGEFDRIQTEIFNQSCLGAGCHNSQSQAGGLNLTAGVSYESLVDIVPVNPVAAAGGRLRVDPFVPANSFLVVKLRGPGAGEGTRMPLGASPLSAAQIGQIEAWILDGAPRGGTAPPTETVTPVPPTPTDTETPTVSPTPTQTGTATRTVTGTAPPTSTPSETATPTPTATPTATVSLFTQIQQTIFNPTCTDVFCHDFRDLSGDLTLIEGESYGELVDVLSFNFAAREEGLLRVQPNAPDQSFLMIKLEPILNPDFGERMPLGKPALTAEQMQLIRDWIAAGAQP